MASLSLRRPVNVPPTRRAFVATTSRALAGLWLAPRAFGARARTVQRFPAAIAHSSLSAEALLPEPLAPLALRDLALAGIDAATHAGATYADIRVGEAHVVYVSCGDEVDVSLKSTFTYGVRVLVDGAWGFAYGRDASTDAVAASARAAVATARGYAPLVVQRAELAPATVATGEWATPVKEDPFTVPLHDHNAIAYAYGLAGGRVHRAAVQWWNSSFDWTKETRVFASSEGALITQTLRTVNPFVLGGGLFLDPRGIDGVSLRYPGLVACSGGFEVVSDPTIPAKLKRWTEELAQLAALPWGTLDVGRYPVVFDGRSTGVLLGTTLGRALELDRVLGDEAGASGSSYVSPPNELLGTLVASPLLSVGAHRALPSPTAAKWDDEGVETHAYPLITEGRLVDYHTSRQHAVALKDWYAQQHQPLLSHGSVLVPSADAPAMIRAPHLTMTPSSSAASLEMLCREISHGLLVIDMPHCRTDQQLASAFYNLEGGTPVLEIKQGQPVRRLQGIALDLSAKRLWKEQLVAVGDASTVGTTSVPVYKGMPWRESQQAATTPALHVKDVNVISTMRRL